MVLQGLFWKGAHGLNGSDGTVLVERTLGTFVDIAMYRAREVKPTGPPFAFRILSSASRASGHFISLGNSAIARVLHDLPEGD